MTHNPDRPIVLVKIEQESETNHPLALLFLSCALRKANYQSKILLERTGHFEPGEFARQIAALNPLFVGLSSITRTRSPAMSSGPGQGVGRFRRHLMGTSHRSATHRLRNAWRLFVAADPVR